jgi:hypothetical protein
LRRLKQTLGLCRGGLRFADPPYEPAVEKPLIVPFSLPYFYAAISASNHSRTEAFRHAGTIDFNSLSSVWSKIDALDETD